MRPRVLIATGAVLAVLSGCEKREVAPAAQQGADRSAAASPTSGSAVDTLADSTRRPPADSAYIGRDSAFGPLFAVDSTGKMVELPVRRP